MLKHRLEQRSQTHVAVTPRSLPPPNSASISDWFGCHWFGSPLSKSHLPNLPGFWHTNVETPSQKLQQSQIVVTPPTSPPPPNRSPKMSHFAAIKTAGKCPQVSSKVYSFGGTHRAGVCHEVSEKISNSFSMLKYHLELWSDTWQLSCQTTLKNVSTSYQKYMVFHRKHGWISCKKYPVISHLQKLKRSVEHWSLVGSLLAVQPPIHLLLSKISSFVATNMMAKCPDIALKTFSCMQVLKPNLKQWCLALQPSLPAVSPTQSPTPTKILSKISGFIVWHRIQNS